MKRKLYWGLVILIGLLISVFAVLLMQTTDTKPSITVYKDVEPTARPGYKLVPHGDHYHEVPIAQADEKMKDVPHQTPVDVTEAPMEKAKAVATTRTGPLTYHEELLETNPVKALRLQAEERGHWGKDYIPPFPPDDTEAQTFAKNLYLITYYRSIDDIDNPICQKAIHKCSTMLDIINTYPYSARTMDLMRLTWPNRRGIGKVTHASDYFDEYTGLPK